MWSVGMEEGIRPADIVSGDTILVGLRRGLDLFPSDGTHADVCGQKERKQQTDDHKPEYTDMEMAFLIDKIQ